MMSTLNKISNHSQQQSQFQQKPQPTPEDMVYRKINRIQTKIRTEITKLSKLGSQRNKPAHVDLKLKYHVLLELMISNNIETFTIAKKLTDKVKEAENLVSRYVPHYDHMKFRSVYEERAVNNKVLLMERIDVKIEEINSRICELENEK